MNKQVNGKVRSFFRQVVEKNRCRKGWWPNQRNKERLHNSLYRMVLVIRIHCNPKPLVIRTRKMKS
ncbi:unnamed protein product [Nezara viridula]|uniref:Uncharacterized protein n=1 Tax=Nezara viridula TaxID=85310 RepID=A0A9P0HUY1_NEZVI|nr:unnamed protein product [Nezara viridula]